jgi:hypothetical protein
MSSDGAAFGVNEEEVVFGSTGSSIGSSSSSSSGGMSASAHRRVLHQQRQQPAYTTGKETSGDQPCVSVCLVLVVLAPC